MRASRLTLLVSVILLTACGKKGSRATQGSPPPSPVAPNESRIPARDWDLSQIKFECEDKACPPQIGVLFFEVPQRQGYLKVYRCTAFLVGADTVMSNEHCNLFGHGPGQFLLYGGGGKVQIRAVEKVLYHEGKSNLGSKFSDGRPDVAAFKLQEPITDVTPLKLARGPQEKFAHLYGYVVNGGEDGRTLRIEKIECQVHRHEIYFPYNISESPDVIFGFGCHAELGNSGSPLFAKGSPDVQSILQAASPALRDTGYAFTEQPFIISTNLRCLDFPGPSGVNCLKADGAESSRRFERLLGGVLQSLSERKLPQNMEGKFQFKAYPYFLRPEEGVLHNIGVLYFPTCYSQEPQSTYPLPIENVELNFNVWGEPQLTSAGFKSAPASFVKLSNSHYLVVPDLASPFSRTFSIALHPCTS